MQLKQKKKIFYQLLGPQAMTALQLHHRIQEKPIKLGSLELWTLEMILPFQLDHKSQITCGQT